MSETVLKTWEREDVLISEALAPLARAIRSLEALHGPNVLEAGPADIVARLASARGKLASAIDADDVNLIRARAEVVVRGLRLLVDHLPAPRSAVWHVGDRVVVLHSEDIHLHPDALTIAELLAAYDIVRGKVEPIKRAFPGAVIVSPSRESDGGRLIDDEIPF